MELRPLTERELAGYSREFRATSRVIVPEFLADAAQLSTWIEGAEGWKESKAAGTNSSGLKYHYESIMLFGSELPRNSTSTFPKELTRFVASNAFVQLAVRITERHDIIRADGHLTRFRAGHYLDLHLDSTQDGEPRGVRRIAFVIGMTRTWNPNWGGWTLFLQGRGSVGSAVYPGYNQLLLFSVPQPHLVTVVTSDCSSSRYSVSGWLRSDA